MCNSTKAAVPKCPVGADKPLLALTGFARWLGILAFDAVFQVHEEC